ncbi:antitoxin [Limnofasciculus baicalensis]|uniref:AbrB/MazE/SpoVT family DNA-binding domain-containing protein n=1 Tax=Limnofasciculus baicalensis BBK-W-15 TaxID=2699891 RepID=A0AAE3GMG4_9CYAN|nr:AbrB/MazE/SpoVT family DNA-binding domain-containing protein [Limnofasciculus baicalensis]MCP2727084.1 AbrB/MazE/SpoVT family DNA-binding domain-containing protein [Limnofasciculus baicalensis BBK-W-15]
MPNSCHAYLLRNGQDQVLTIPYKFALPGTEVLLRKEGNRLIIEPIRPGSLLSLLTTLVEITDNFPDVDEGLLPLDDIAL